MFDVFGCQYQCNWLPGKNRLRNDLLCVEWDVNPYTLTHSLPPKEVGVNRHFKAGEREHLGHLTQWSELTLRQQVQLTDKRNANTDGLYMESPVRTIADSSVRAVALWYLPTHVALTWRHLERNRTFSTVTETDFRNSLMHTLYRKLNVNMCNNNLRL